MLDFDHDRRFVLKLSRLGGRYLLGVKECKPQVAHEDVDEREGSNLG